MNKMSVGLFVATCVLCARTTVMADNDTPIDRSILLRNGDLAVVLGAKSTPAEKRVSELLGERLKVRSGIALAASGTTGKVQLVIGTTQSNDRIKSFVASQKEFEPLGPDGYAIEVVPTGKAIYVVGQSNSGVVTGVGRLMREIAYRFGLAAVPQFRIAETPKMPNRGMYLWARKYYFAEPDRVDRYIEELALWGCNGISFWFEMGMFKSFHDTSEQNPKEGYSNHQNTIPPKEWIAMYKRFYATARRMGMKTGLLMVANDAYRSSPEDLRIEPIIGTPECYMCASKPGAVAQMLIWQEEVFKALAPIDIFNIFPADPGGCACKACQPWPTHGFWKAAKPLGDLIHKLSPETEIWIDTWHLNHPTFGGKDWINLVNQLASDQEVPEWFTGFEVGLAPNHKFARTDANDRDVYSRAKQPLMVFPDISMWGNHSGMLVKTAYWTSLQREMNAYGPGLMKGGWPYAERWNTDIACVAFLSWFWNPQTPIDQVLDDYVQAYFGSSASGGCELLRLLDDNKNPDNNTIKTALARLQSSAPEWVKRDWRWQEIVACCEYKIERAK